MRRLQRRARNGESFHDRAINSVSTCPSTCSSPRQTAPINRFTDLYGPVDGNRHDAFIWNESGLEAGLRDYLTTDDDVKYYVYGDPAYALSDIMITPFPTCTITADKAAFNKSMSSVRQGVETEFKETVINFAFMDYKKNLKLLLQPVAKLYAVATFLKNVRLCKRVGQTGLYFDMPTPSVNEYLNS